MRDKSIPNSTIESIPYGYCHCGCGQKTNIARKSNATYGYVEGEPVRFMRGHRIKRAVVETTCDQCGAPIIKDNWQMKAHANHFCSRACAYEFRRIGAEKKKVKARAIQARWRENNRDKHNAKAREWAARNHEKVMELQRVRRAPINQSTLPRDVRSLAFSVYGDACLSCGSKESVEVDHVIPLTKGGTHTVENLQPLCRSCNASKGQNSTDYRKAGAA